MKAASLAEMRRFADANRAPGHWLRPVLDDRHIVYRPRINFGNRYGCMAILPPYSWEVYKGRFLLGGVTRMDLGDWFAWPEGAKALGSFRKRSHAAAALVDLAGDDYACRETGGRCLLRPNLLTAGPQWNGPHACNVARMGGRHMCMCVCGIALDLDDREEEA